MVKRRQRKPHFFKVLLGDFSQRLRIPPNFVKHISEEASKRAILEGPSGGTWPVELGRTMRGMYLLGGWQNFVKDNSLVEFEFLLFRYEGRMRFSVRVFDTNACEREDGFMIKGSTSCRGGREVGGPQKHPVDFGCLVPLKACKVEPTKPLDDDMHERHHSWQGYYFSSVQGRCLSSLKPDELVKAKIEEDDPPISTVFPRRNRSRTGTRPNRSTIAPRPKRTYGYLSLRRPVSAQERERARKAANSFTSSLPFFVTNMMISNVYKTYMLTIPTSFAKAHLPGIKEQLVLRDPKENAWVVRFFPSPRSRISGGWSAFSRGNNLEEGDFCVFELVRPSELRVHIFRLVEEITPLVKL